MRGSSSKVPLRAIRSACRRSHSTETTAAPAASGSTTAEAPTPRLRFAPSPTGNLHLGGLRTALLNHLVARKGNGKWILRIEDTDRTRTVPGAVDSLRRSLEWAGLDYDEGIGAGGDYGPYIQSERVDLYHQYAKQLLDSDHAYECFCSREEIDAIETARLAEGKRGAYDGRCRHLTDEDRVRRKKAGEKYVIRFKDPGGAPVMPEDIVFGQTAAHTDTGHENVDDIILIKQDGFPTYHLAHVVDDHEMRITHVLRGQEWLPSLPKHVKLYTALGWEMPQFAHLPLLVNASGEKLSKRRNDEGIDYLREQGYEPEAIVNLLGVLGWDYQAALERTHGTYLPDHIRSDRNSMFEVFSLPQLIQSFDLSAMTRRKAMISPEKLDFLNKMTLRRKAGTLGKDLELAEIGKPRTVWGSRVKEGRDKLVKRFADDLKSLPELAGNPLLDDKEYIETVFEVELPRTTRLNQMAPGCKYFFLEPDYDSAEAKNLYASVKQNSYVSNLEAMIMELDIPNGTRLDTDLVWQSVRRVQTDLGVRKRSEIMLQMRHALTGHDKGPGVPEIIVVLGTEKTIARLRAGIIHSANSDPAARVRRL